MKFDKADIAIICSFILGLSVGLFIFDWTDDDQDTINLNDLQYGVIALYTVGEIFQSKPNQEYKLGEYKFNNNYSLGFFVKDSTSIVEIHVGSNTYRLSSPIENLD